MNADDPPPMFMLAGICILGVWTGAALPGVSCAVAAAASNKKNKRVLCTGSPLRLQQEMRGMSVELQKRVQKKKATVVAFYSIRCSTTLRRRSRSCRGLRHGCCRGGFVQDSVVNREQCQFQAVRDADLVVHVAQVVLDDLLSRAKLRGDFFVLVTLYDQRDDTP